MPQTAALKKQLVIVESPAKAKTIKQFLGDDYKVLSSFGHIRDLPSKGLNIDIDKNFEPNYAVSPDKKKVVSELRKEAKTAKEVWLASDEDREGEAIAWHLCYVLGLDPTKTKRIVFHEITKSAIEDAIKHPRNVDIRLVDSQQARRVLDRLVGYELSPLLWKKVKTGLSAGRVQSVAVRLIVDREREIRSFESVATYKVVGNFNSGSDNFDAKLEKNLKDKKSSLDLLEKAKSATFTVTSISEKPGSRNPSAPFTTSSLQQEASRKLSYSVRQTMLVAQKLYENGHITYMRTDSTTLSNQALNNAKTYIMSNFGDKYYARRQYKTKNESAQEAHEAIRPTNFNKLTVNGDSQQNRLYQLIWQRSLASQMAPAETNRTDVNIEMSNHSEVFNAKGEVLVFDGFYKVYGKAKDDTLLPKLTEGQELKLNRIEAGQDYSRPSARYSEASLVKKMEELGIGRPSTYAPTISTIQTRGYIEKTDLEGQERQRHVLMLENGQITESDVAETIGADRNKLVPTSLAEVTTDFLVNYFGHIVDYDFTASVENNFDKVAEGKEQWTKVIKDFYGDFHPLIAETEKVSRQEVSQARLIGNDPKSGKPIYARFGKYGPMLQRGEAEDEHKPDFAPMPDGQTIETIDLDGALKMFSLPREVGKTKDGETVIANIGRFGPYVQVGKLFVSIKNYDPFSISLDEALILYKDKKQQEKNKNIAEFASGVKILNGPYGPYVTDGKKNARIPKGTDPKSITEDAAKEMLASAKPGRRFRRKKS